MTNETNDRELLELASKAAGLRVVDRSAPISLRVESDGCKSGAHWNPLSDDGDALRLAVKLNIIVFQHHGHSHALDDDEEIEIIEPHNDRYAATRRAIVRAAVEIGRNMQ